MLSEQKADELIAAVNRLTAVIVDAFLMEDSKGGSAKAADAGKKDGRKRKRKILADSVIPEQDEFYGGSSDEDDVTFGPEENKTVTTPVATVILPPSNRQIPITPIVLEEEKPSIEGIEVVEVLEMPPPPVFEQAPSLQSVAPLPDKAPFTDASGMIGYVVNSYAELGPSKGAKIQDVLTKLGFKNINQVGPDYYDALFVGIESIKRIG